MKCSVVLGLLAVGFLAGASATWADIAPFPKPNPTKAKFTVEVNNNVTQAQLHIPKKFISTVGKFGGVGLEDQQEAFAPTAPTIVAGFCLSLAVVCMGVWLVRRNRTRIAPVPLAWGIGLVTVVAVASVASSLVWANFPPPNLNKNPPPNPNFFLVASLINVADEIQVTVTPAGDSIKLVINQQMYNRLKNTNVNGFGGPPFPPPGVNPGPGFVPPGTNPAPGVGSPPASVNPIPMGTPPTAQPKSGVGSAPPPAKLD